MKCFRLASLLGAAMCAAFAAAQYQVVILGPATGFNFTTAYACANGQQGGQGQILPSYEQHALLWTNSSSSMVDLHPSGYGPASFIYGVGGGQQGGFVSDVNGSPHAAVWTGTPSSVVILDAGMGAAESYVFGVSGGQQVGEVNMPAIGE